jgi:hypothetical protein
MGISWGLGTLVTHGHLGVGGLGEAPDVYVGWLRPAQNLVDIIGGAPVQLRDVWSIGRDPADDVPRPLSVQEEDPGLMGISWGLGTLVTHGHLGAGGLGEAPDVYDFEPPSSRRLYKIAHSESTVDYVDNPV